MIKRTLKVDERFTIKCTKNEGFGLETEGTYITVKKFNIDEVLEKLPCKGEDEFVKYLLKHKYITPVSELIMKVQHKTTCGLEVKLVRAKGG